MRDHDRAPSLLYPDCEQAGSRSCVGRRRTDGRRDLDHVAAARLGRSGHLIAAAISAAPFRPSHKRRELRHWRPLGRESDSQPGLLTDSSAVSGDAPAGHRLAAAASNGSDGLARPLLVVQLRGEVKGRACSRSPRQAATAPCRGQQSRTGATNCQVPRRAQIVTPRRCNTNCWFSVSRTASARAGKRGTAGRYPRP